MTTMEELRKKLQEKQETNKTNNTSTGDNASFPFWNMKEGSTATIRFLPDGNDENVFFWVDREVIRLPFEGVVGGDRPTDKQVTVQVPCVEMFGMTCPIISAIRPWWKQGPDMEALAKKYYKKRSHIYQGFVVNSSLEEDEVPENPIRRFVINPSIHKIIEQSLVNPEMEDIPTDYVGGRDFKITKGKKGEWADYGSSQWSFKTRSLEENELLAIEQYGLFTLSDYLGKVPDSDELDAIKAMFDDSVKGVPFDYDSYGKYYRPYGLGSQDSDDVISNAKSVASKISEVKKEVPEENTSDSSDSGSDSSGKTTNAHEILERIKNRKKSA